MAAHQVIVVEDAPAIQAMLGLAFQVRGIHAILAGNAVDARERLPEEVPAAILCDVQLPGMNGVEFTKWLKSHPKLREFRLS